MTKKRPPRWPFKCGDSLPGKVTHFSDKGVARAEVEGVELRLYGAVPGDEGMIRITHTGKNAAWGTIHELQKPSPDRVEAPCPVVDRCGGCPWQMVSIEAQRKFRMERIDTVLGDLLGEATRHDWATPAVQTDYRTRAMMMTVKRRGTLGFGFYAPGTRHLIIAPDCDVQHPTVNHTLEAARKIIDEEEMSIYGGPQRRGLLKAVLFRVDPAMGRGLLTMVVNRWHHTLAPIAAKLGELPAVVGVFANISNLDSGPVLGEETRHLFGSQVQQVRYGSMVLEVGPTSFLQTHHEAAQHLLETVGGMLPEKMEHLVDLYAGVGVFGLAFRDRAARVTLVERESDSVKDAIRNVNRLGAKHIKVVETKAEAFMNRKPEVKPPPDGVILDPPRSGCGDDVIQSLCLSSHPMHVVYVSCGLESLGRDLRKLREGGFTITDLVPIDMFPHTPHQELVVGLRRD